MFYFTVNHRQWLRVKETDLYEAVKMNQNQEADSRDGVQLLILSQWIALKIQYHHIIRYTNIWRALTNSLPSLPYDITN